MIEFDNVSFTYEGANAPALRGVSLDVAEGDFLGIVGPTAAGKTTLAFAMCGAIPHCYRGDFYGSASVAGMDTFEASLTDIAHKVGTVLQDIDAQMVSTVVEDEILFGLENFGVAHDEIEARIVDVLEMLDIADLRQRPICTLSGGQKQKVALAAMLALAPRVLVLDEPTGALDPAASQRVFEALKMLNDQGITIVVIEQNVGLLAAYARHLLVMDGGTAVIQGTTRDVLAHADTLKELGIAVPRVVDLSLALCAGGFTDGRFCIDVDEAHRLLKELIA